MKNQVLFFLLSIICYNSFAQNNFEKGYFIDNYGKITNCLIKNVDWKNNPTDFQYKLSENEKLETLTIDTVKEFGINNFSKHIRAIVNIDRSSSNIDRLSKEREPVFMEEKLFLKTIIEGDANLYYYEDANLRRFFFNVKNADIQQLVFKNYLKDDHNFSISENNSYKQQLFSTLKCDKISFRYVKNIDYNKEDLIKLIEKYNSCSSATATNFDAKPKRDAFNLTIKAGLVSSSLEITSGFSNYRNVDFDNHFGLQFGIETEYILPFNNNKWSFIVAPRFQKFTETKEVINNGVVGLYNQYTAEVNYNTFEVPFGVRHYLFLNENAKLFLDASYILVLPTASNVKYSTGTNVEIKKSSAFEFGFGFNYNHKFSMAFKYGIPREILSNYRNESGDYKNGSLVLGYTIF